MVVVMDERALTNNLLGRGHSDSTPVAFRPWDTLHARVTQGIVAGAVGDLLILNAVNGLTDQQADMFAAAEKRRELEEYEEGKRILARNQERAHGKWLATQRQLKAPPPLERQPGESDAVFALKQLARHEFLSKFSR